MQKLVGIARLCSVSPLHIFAIDSHLLTKNVKEIAESKDLKLFFKKSW